MEVEDGKFVCPSHRDRIYPANYGRMGRSRKQALRCRMAVLVYCCDYLGLQ